METLAWGERYPLAEIDSQDFGFAVDSRILQWHGVSLECVQIKEIIVVTVMVENAR